MKKIIALATLLASGSLTFAAPPLGSSISYTNSATAAGNNTFVDIALNKFDTGLGTLTGVVVTVNFTTIDGSFTVSTTTPTSADVDSASARITIRQATTNSLGFAQLGQTSFDMTQNVSPSIDPTPYTVPGSGGSQLFNITSPTNVFVNNVQNIGGGFWGAYQSAGGLGSVVFQVRNAPSIAAAGGAYTVDGTAFTALGNMSVTYNYTPAAVPEPGTWAGGALLVAGAAYTMWRRRNKPALEAATAA